jgi:DNA-binding CsgD family transcriptional regulator
MNVFAELARPLINRPGCAIDEPKAAPVKRARKKQPSKKRVLPVPPNPWGASGMQAEVLRMRVAGLDAIQIGEVLCISHKTVAEHLRRLKDRMKVDTVMQAAILWDRHFRDQPTSEAAAPLPNNQE